MENPHEKFWLAVREIPRGRVASYGEVAARAGKPRGARAAARAMGAIPEDGLVPWWRVVNSKGEIAERRAEAMELQKDLLLEEGVVFETRWRVKPELLN